MFRKCGKLRVDIIILYHIVHEQQICMLFELCCMHNSVAYYLSIMKCMRENVVKHLQNMIKYNVSYKQITYYIYINNRDPGIHHVNNHLVFVCNCVFSKFLAPVSINGSKEFCKTQSCCKCRRYLFPSL